MKSKEKEESRIGPVNPFALGNVFIEAAKKSGWMVEEQVERQRRYYITPAGFTEMEKLGMDLQRVAHYRPMTPLPENTLSRHERPAPGPEDSFARHRRLVPQQASTLSHHERPRRPEHPSRRHDRHFDRHRH
jgi:hypothetical protein